MEGGGKRRQRRRLLRFAVPYLKSIGTLAIPPIHEHCDEAPCIECAAKRYLTLDDWAVIEFFCKVQDQSVNLTPSGTKDGTVILAPRLEGWVAACELYSIPHNERAAIVDMARLLFEGIHGRAHEPGLQQVPVADLLPPEEPF